MKLFSRKSIYVIAKSDYEKAAIQSIKAQAALEDAEFVVKKLNVRINRISNILTMGPRTSAAASLLREQLYESNIELLNAHNAMEYAKSEVESQDARLLRLQQFLSLAKDEKTTNTDSLSTAK